LSSKLAAYSIFLLILCIFAENRAAYAQTIDPKAKPFSVSGSLGGNFSYNAIDGIPRRRQPYGYGIFANVNFKLYGWNIPLRLAINEQGSSFSQPFSRIGISPEYKWVKVHLGHRNMRFSEFTLNNATFLGAGLELKPGKFRFSSFYGRMRRAVKNPRSDFERVQFERIGYGASVGLGRDSYFDLSFFRAFDVVSSLDVPDTTLLRNDPEANTAIGLSGKIKFVKNRLSLDYDLGISAFTRDLTAPDIDLEQSAAGRSLKAWDINQSSNAAAAARAALNYKKEFFSFGIDYRYVQNGYRSLGVNYLLSDVQFTRFTAGLVLLQKKLNINASIGLQENNLSNRKFAKTNRNIGSLALNYRVTDRLTLNLNYSNFSVYQTVLVDSLFADSVVIDQTNQLVNGLVSYLIPGELRTQTISIAGNYQELADGMNDARFENTIWAMNLNYSIRFNKKKFSLNASANYQDFSSFITAQKRYGAGIGAVISALKNKLNIRLNQTWNTSQLNNRDNDNLFNSRATFTYQLKKKHRLSLNFAYISRVGFNDFSEFRAGIGYNMRF